jgi:hypothetical protein
MMPYIPLHTLRLRVQRTTVAAHVALFVVSVIAAFFVERQQLFSQTFRAQILSTGGTYPWMQPSTWGRTSGFPSSTNATVASALIESGFRPITMTNSAPPFRVDTLRLAMRSITSDITTATVTQGIVRLLPRSSSEATITISTLDFTSSGTLLVVGAGLRLVLEGSILTSQLDSSLPAPRILVERNATLELTLSTTNTLSRVQIEGTDASSSVIVRSRIARMLLPSARFSPSTTNLLQARLLLDGTFTLNGELRIGQNGAFDFGSGTNKLILGTHNIVCLGTVMNASSARYFVTNMTGNVRLGGVGNTTFQVGASETTYSPLFVSNNGAPSEFSVRANTPLSPIVAPLAAVGSSVLQPSVGIRWIVTQHTNISAGISVTLTPQWATSQEGAGFNRTIASVHRFTESGQLVQSSAPAMATAVSGSTNFVQSSLVIAQTQPPGSLVNSSIIVTSQPQPAILSFTPTAVASNQTVTIIGQRFVNVQAVRFGGVNASSFVVISPDTIRAVVSAGGASGYVTVHQTGGIAQSPFPSSVIITPVQRPSIFTALPQPLTAGIGDIPMTITGSGFGNLNVRVEVRGSGAQGVITPTSSSLTRITCNVPGQFLRNIGILTLTVTSTDKNPVSTNVSIVAASPFISQMQPSTTTASLRAFTVRVQGRNFGIQSRFSLNQTMNQTMNQKILRLMDFQSAPDGLVTAFVEVPADAESSDILITNLNAQSTSASLTIVPTTDIVNKEETLKSITIAPNPSTDNISIYAAFHKPTHLRLRLTDMLGRELLQEEVQAQSGAWSRLFSLQHLPQGTYFLEVFDITLQRSLKTQKIWKKE